MSTQHPEFGYEVNWIVGMDPYSHGSAGRVADLYAGDLDPLLQSCEFIPEVHRGFAASIAYELVDDALGGHTVGSQPILPGFVVVVGLCTATTS